MKKIISILMMLCIVPLCLGEEETVVGNDICNYIKDTMDVGTGTTVPSGIPYSNEVFDVWSDDHGVASITIEDKKVSKVECGPVGEDATYDITIAGVDTLKYIWESDSRADALNDKMKSDEFTIAGKTFTKKVKGAFSVLAIKVASVFS